MPNGYETYIEEGSPNLSGGQKQRLAIARALITDPRILILDEATSALDPESEALVNANLMRIARGRTMVIVSHRLSSLVDCDQILVLEQGKIVDVAPHDILLERCSLYRQLWMQQNRHLEGHGVGRRQYLRRWCSHIEARNRNVFEGWPLPAPKLRGSARVADLRRQEKVKCL